MQAEDIAMEDLPETLAQIAEVIGVAATMKLVDALGGTEIYVPRNPSSKHALSRVLRATDAELLAAEFSGQRLHIPRLAGRALASRDAAIRLDRQSGMTTIQLALKYGISERQVRRSLAH